MKYRVVAFVGDYQLPSPGQEGWEDLRLDLEEAKQMAMKVASQSPDNEDCDYMVAVLEGESEVIAGLLHEGSWFEGDAAEEKMEEVMDRW
jgi:hypothetical protein